ncbi:MAG: EAL domain-containing protein [Actinomycetota bacterium]
MRGGNPWQSEHGGDVDRFFADLFPFHLVIDLHPSPTVVAVADSLARWLGRDLTGTPFADCFTIADPAIADLNRETLVAERRAVFVLEAVEHFARLRGQMMLVGENRAVFIGSPVLTSTTTVEELGLSVDDFAPHDATVDLITIQRDCSAQLADLWQRAEELERVAPAPERLPEEAAADPLTGLANRRTFWARCSTELQAKRRVALLFIDIDRFKTVNEAYGHRVGDRVLQELGARLQSSLRSIDLVARLGGDEFAVLLADVDQQAAVSVIERIRSVAAQPIRIGDHVCRISISIGVVPGTPKATVDDLIQDADAAMYEGRQFGPGRVTWFASRMRDDRRERRTLTDDLERAITHGEITAVFQPIVDLPTRAIRSCEALARWEHSDQGFIAPSRFIAIAEDAALVDRLDDLIMSQALGELERWQRTDPSFGLQVNVSGRSIGPTLVSRVSQALEGFTVQPETLTIEVTESWLIQHETEVAAALQRIAELGVRIHLYDFGTGYSSLAHIHSLPITGLKIDRSFVVPASQSERSRRLIAATIGMARTLELDVVAEGVEDEATARMLTELGCDYAQGYHFARPGPPETIAGLLASGPVDGRVG